MKIQCLKRGKKFKLELSVITLNNLRKMKYFLAEEQMRSVYADSVRSSD